MAVTEVLPEFPTARSVRCPFDPPGELQRFQDEDSVTRIRWWDGSSPWLVTRYQDQRSILADDRVSADTRHPGYPHRSDARQYIAHNTDLWRPFIKMDNPEHQVVRRMLTRDFAVRKVEDLRPKTQLIVDELIDAMLAKGPPVDLVHEFALPVPSLVICELLGVAYDDRDTFQRCSDVMGNVTASPEEVLAAANEFRAFIGELIDAKDAAPGDDLVSRLVVDYVRTGATTKDEVVSTVLLLLNAGHETTANMIALGTLTLLRHPDQLDEIRTSDDPRVVANAVEELLRYLTIVQLGRQRVALEDIEIGGKTIHKGDGIVMPENIGNRDATVFENPNRFDIHRDARHHIAFGYGTHQCLGQPLARAELQVVFSTLFQRIPTLQLAIPFEDLHFKETMAIYGVHQLPITW